MDPARIALNFGQSPTMRCLTVSKIAITADKFTVEFMTHELLKIARSVTQDQSAIYIHAHMRPDPHPRLLKSDMPCISNLVVHSGADSCSSLLLCDQLCRLLSELKCSKEPLPDILQAFQVIMSFATTLLFTGAIIIVEPKEKLLRHMREVSVRLLQDGPSMMPTTLSRWQTWILAESVRRAILMTCLIQGVYHGWLRGFCYHEVFIQALPFDVRPGLWNAESEDEWDGLMNNHPRFGSWNRWSELVSFREFADSFAKSPFDPGLDNFQRLLLTAHHGKAPVDRTVGILFT
ncbi:hypothetical protein PV08_00948 [Exophiala spinifera]|uniref:Transcription factor domain-containing protein n=1 Tax=Exophiala spinifera TaxID=91928 RepID=A0A0D2BN55_9EURO|nr:uncharacterized protein PV08_00948 [Exophiala spinifera]KIW20373.1 hypothetical protein PV08_00948 [Exophiala spinifera]